MGVYIKDMTLDEFNEYGDDCQTLIGIGQAEEVPPHGRLIDADALYDELEDYYKNRQGLERRGIRHCIELVTEYAPTIIESEGENGDT